MNVVYFVRCEGRIKIGFSAQIEQRMSNLRVSNPKPIELLAKIPGGRALEKALHKHLKHKRVRNEWFEDCVEVRAAMGEVAAKGYLMFPGCEEKSLVDDCEREEIEHGLAEATRRITRIAFHPFLVNVRRAFAIEKQANLKRGSLVAKEILKIPNGSVCHGQAIEALRDASARLDAISDKMILATCAEGDFQAASDLAAEAAIMVANMTEEKIYALLGPCDEDAMDNLYFKEFAAMNYPTLSSMAEAKQKR